MKSWVWSLFERNDYKELITSLFVGAYFVNWVKLLGLPFAIPKTFEKFLGYKIGFSHGTHDPKPWIGLSKASLVWEARILVFTNLTPLAEHVHLNLKKTWVTFCVRSQVHILVNSTWVDPKTLCISFFMRMVSQTRDETMGLILLWEVLFYFLLRDCKLVMRWSIIWKVGEIPWISSCYPQNFEKKLKI